jgi:hypothetical protein
MLGQGQESVRFICGRLGTCVSKQLAPVIDQSIAVAIKRQPGVIRSGCGPTNGLWLAIGINVETNSAWLVRQSKAIAIYIDQNRTGNYAAAGRCIPVFASGNTFRSRPGVVATAGGIGELAGMAMYQLTVPHIAPGHPHVHATST